MLMDIAHSVDVMADTMQPRVLVYDVRVLNLSVLTPYGTIIKGIMSRSGSRAWWWQELYALIRPFCGVKQEHCGESRMQ